MIISGNSAPKRHLIGYLELQNIQLTEERRVELRDQIAVASTQLLQDPESHLANLRTLLVLAADADTQARLNLCPATHAVGAFGKGDGTYPWNPLNELNSPHRQFSTYCLLDQPSQQNGRL